MNKCPLCNAVFADSEDLERHLLEEHFLTMQSFYEMLPIEQDKGRVPISYIENDGFFLPDWDNIKNKYEKVQSINMVQSAIKDYYNKVSTDRYLQMYLINDIYFESTLSHKYSEFKDILKQIQRKYRYDRNKIWFLDWIPGFPRLISEDNLDGIKVVLIDDLYKVVSDQETLSLNNYSVKFPEIIPYDRRYHSKYNLLNLNGDPRTAKRLRLKNEMDDCIKFYNNSDSSARSLFRIQVNDDIIEPNNLTDQDLTVLKLLLLRNKTFMKLITSMIDEISKNAKVLSDSVFLKNTILVNPGNQAKINISWLPNKEKENYINISIL